MFDGHLIAADERWREAVVHLFVRGAEVFGAFFAAAQLEPGWIVSRNNRPFAQAESVQESEHFLRGMWWQGLPPVPVWLSWYGGPYRELVSKAVHVGGSPEEAEVEERESGIFVRLGPEPRPRPQLLPLPLPPEVTYRERRAIDDHLERR
jgi:hypothetical protein